MEDFKFDDPKDAKCPLTNDPSNKNNVLANSIRTKRTFWAKLNTVSKLKWLSGIGPRSENRLRLVHA